MKCITDMSNKKKKQSTASGSAEEKNANGTGKKDEKEPTKKEQFMDDLIWFCKVLCISCVIALAIRFLTPIIFVSGNSMNNTLYDKEMVLGCSFVKPDNSDIVVFHGHDAGGKEEVLIKRVIGKPGDTVVVKNDDIWVNGEKLEEDYICLSDRYYPDKDITVTLGDEEYFVCGDNRHDSYDSRMFGVVNRDQIFAKVIFKLDLRPVMNIFKKKS